LSHADIAIVNKEKGTVELIAEIEEHGSSPKKSIGDIVNIILSDKVRIDGEDYGYGEKLCILLAVKGDSKGKAQAKLEKICDGLKKWKSPGTSIVSVFNSNADGLINEAEKMIKSHF